MEIRAGRKEKAMKYVTLFEKGLWHRCFPIDFTKFPIIPFLQNTQAASVFINIVEQKLVNRDRDDFSHEQ